MKLPQINKNTYNTGIFELRRCVVCREFTVVGLRDQKNQERGNERHLEQATATAAESCSSAREACQILSSAITTNRQSITTTQPRANPSDGQSKTRKRHLQPSAARVSRRTIQHVPDPTRLACGAKHDNNRSQPRNCASIRLMNKAGQASPTRSHQRHEWASEHCNSFQARPRPDEPRLRRQA
jgi:hypothetical protein